MKTTAIHLGCLFMTIMIIAIPVLTVLSIWVGMPGIFVWLMIIATLIDACFVGAILEEACGMCG